MHEQYWNLQRNPFDSGFHAESFVRSESHEAALLRLQYLIENRKSAGLLIGGTGCGKSYLIRMLAHELGDEYRPFLHLVFPQMGSTELLAYLATQLGANDSAVDSRTAGVDRIVREIEKQLLAHAEQSCKPVIVIDEAHLIDDVRIFQSLQLLMNLHVNDSPPFTLILVGEHSLLSRVSRLAQLEQRLSVKAVLHPLTRDETAAYIAHRLQAVGRTEALFADEAIDAIFELSCGVPRRVDRLCDLGLLVGFADELPRISGSEIEAVAEEISAVTSS